MSEVAFPQPLNCTAVSPDRRLRVMVGDSPNVRITPAQNERTSDGRPEILHELTGHRDNGFACDWADDGHTVATGFQDRAHQDLGRPPLVHARVHPAHRDVGRPLPALLPARLRPRVLVAAEEADFINIIDAQTFRTKQTIDVFGELGGVAFTDDGQELYALLCELVRGGILQFDRCGILADSADLETTDAHQSDPRRTTARALDWHLYGRRRQARVRQRAAPAGGPAAGAGSEAPS